MILVIGGLLGLTLFAFQLSPILRDIKVPFTQLVPIFGAFSPCPRDLCSWLEARRRFTRRSRTVVATLRTGGHKVRPDFRQLLLHRRSGLQALRRSAMGDPNHLVPDDLPKLSDRKLHHFRQAHTTI